jgi:hypothetical protein
MVLAEAMAAGTPVVALDGPGVREILHDGENGILLHGGASADEFTQAMLWIISDEDFSKACSAKARETAADYDTEPCVNRVLSPISNWLTVTRPVATRNGRSGTGWSEASKSSGICCSRKMSAASAAVIETPATEAALD